MSREMLDAGEVSRSKRPPQGHGGYEDKVEIMDALLAADVWIAFLTLLVLEIVLGMDK